MRKTPRSGKVSFSLLGKEHVDVKVAITNHSRCICADVLPSHKARRPGYAGHVCSCGRRWSVRGDDWVCGADALEQARSDAQETQ